MCALYSWGANSHGQLGHGIISEQCATPTLVKSYEINRMRLNSTTKVIGGAGHTFLLTDEGRVYACGSNTSGQLGIGNEEETLKEFKLISVLEGHFITDIVCGWDSTIALTQKNVALVWGSNKHYQIGLKDNCCFHTPEILSNSIKEISMGLRHMAVVTENGELAVAGSNTKGQLSLFNGSGQPVKQSDLRTVTSLANIIKVACGQNHTLVITADGELFGFGDNRHKQICANSPDIRIDRPQKICLFDSISIESDIFCGWTHNALLNKDRTVTLWGRNNYGQLTGITSGPVLIEDVKSIALGSEHCLSVDMNNILYTWGWNEHNNCGIKDAEIVRQRTEIATNCTLIGCGYGYSFAVII